MRIGIALLVGALVMLLYGALGRDDRFVPMTLPLADTDRLFDMGVVDADSDGKLDLYTSNHHFRQVLWLGDGKGGFRDVLGDWGLDQSRDFPNAELSFVAPKPDKPGVYVYWRGTQFVIQTHRSAELGRWQGNLQVLDPVKIGSGQGFEVHKSDWPQGRVTGTTLEFSAEKDARLVLIPGGQGLPLQFRFSGDIRPDQIFVGLGKVSPRTTHFALAMQDRHGHAWADINDDGVLDIFITRGALAGTLPRLPESAARGIRDELLVSRGPGRFEDLTEAMGIEKKGCSGRHASWVDVDRDGVLELFVNCYDREAVEGEYPKQLYKRVGPKAFRDVAQQFSLGLPDQQIGSYAWFDVDADGDVDLLAFQDEGLFLYRQAGGRFVRETVRALDSSGAEKIGHTSESTWFYDGKIVVGDFDGDGDLDAFMASKRGSWLLRNDGGRMVAVDPQGLGLPQQSLTAAWVDYDNDGLLDLHLVPQGLYQQRPDHRFKRTGLLELEAGQYRAAIVNWLDMDNDGRMDVVFALSPEPDYKPWWKTGPPAVRHSTSWQLVARRNAGPARAWMEVDLQGPAGNRQGIGALITVTAGGLMQTRAVGSTEGAFFSQGHYRSYFGLGSSDKAKVRVLWPDGVAQDFAAVEAGRILKIERR